MPQNSKCQQLAQTLDMHGLATVFRCSSAKEKGVWTSLVVLSIVILIIQVGFCIQQFVQNPLVTTASCHIKASLPFPNVYICPTNFVNRTAVKIQNLTDALSFMMDNYFSKAEKCSNEDAVLTKIRRACQRISNLYSLVENMSETGPQINQSDTKSIENFFREISYQTSAFIEEMTFHGAPLSLAANVDEYFDTEYGKCFLVKATDVEQSQAGKGLSLLLNIHTQEYGWRPMDMAMQDGAVLKISEAFNPFSPNKIFALPGHRVKIALQMRRILTINSTLTKPPQACSSHERRLKILHVNYSEHACHLDCDQQGVLRQCGCITPVDLRFLNHNPQYTFCNSSYYCQCSEQALRQNEVKECRITCSQPCEMVIIDHTMSFLSYPSSKFVNWYGNMKALMENDTTMEQNKEGTEVTVEGDDKASGNSINDAWTQKWHEQAITKNWKEDNIVVDIAYSTFNYHILEQTHSMTLITFISHLGGQMGLWIGASLFTIFQLMACVISALWGFYATRKTQDIN